MAVRQEAPGRGQGRPHAQLRGPGGGPGSHVSVPPRALVRAADVLRAPGDSGVAAMGGGILAGGLGGRGAAVLPGAALHVACEFSGSHVWRPPVRPRLVGLGELVGFPLLRRRRVAQLVIIFTSATFLEVSRGERRSLLYPAC